MRREAKEKGGKGKKTQPPVPARHRTGGISSVGVAASERERERKLSRVFGGRD